MGTPLGILAGRVVGPSGAPLQGVTVAIVGGAHPYRDIAAVTGADGAFRLGSVQAGDYRVEARGPGGARSADVTVVAGRSADVVIRFA